MLKQNDIVIVDINGQYEFAQIHYLRDDSKYIAISTRSGRVMGGPFDAIEGEMKGDGAVYSMHKATGAEPGYASAVGYFEDANLSDEDPRAEQIRNAIDDHG